MAKEKEDHVAPTSSHVELGFLEQDPEEVGAHGLHQSRRADGHHGKGDQEGDHDESIRSGHEQIHRATPSHRELWMVSRCINSSLRTRVELTGIRNFDLDHSTLERLVVQCQCVFEALDVAKLYVAEAFGALQLTILDDSNRDYITALEEFGDSL